jgi:hypothetical protein
MKKMFVFGALALASIALAPPANAQGVYLGFGGGPGYGSNGYYGGYRSYRPSYADSYAQEYRRCRVVRVWTGDHYRRIRRCW